MTVTDPRAYRRHLAADKIAFENYGARFSVRGRRHEAPEGMGRERHVGIEFDSYEMALACCD